MAVRSGIDRTEVLNDLLTTFGVTQQRALVRRIVDAGVGMGSDGADRLNLKITAAAVEEMRAAFALFAPYDGVRKATIFGSARTRPGDALYDAAQEVASLLADDDWMVVTGAGPGIMEAAATGAGTDRSLGVSIRLPFEEQPNLIVGGNDNHVAMKYFFTRKLMLVKESSAFICLPGGFGTMDETFELLTLQQTGKMVPVPIVLLDRPGGTYWTRFEAFIRDEIQAGGYADAGDLDRVLITDSVSEAIEHIHAFWRNYVELRWFDETLIIYLRQAPTSVELAELNSRFAPLLKSGVIEISDPMPEEKPGENADLARLRLVLLPRAVGELHRLVGAVNRWESLG